jgi:RecJ-like exonuclease
MDYRSQGDGEPADCPECNGSGNVRVILGDDEQQDRCPSCGGMGYQLTRDEFANLDALQGDRDLRLVDDSSLPSFASHADEIAWHLARRAS